MASVNGKTFSRTKRRTGNPARLKLFFETVVLLYALDELGEDGGVGHGHFGEDFAVEGDILGLHEGDELGVGHTVFTESVVEADDPEGAE